MVVPKSNAQKKNAVIDILTWVECFNSYTAVLTTYFPSRSRDLLAYMALIIRTAKRFRGKAWLDYDRAFCREAAATNLRDWSVMRPDLYNYHTAVVNQYELARNAPNGPNSTAKRSFRDEPQGKPSSNQFCISWNRGFASAASKPADSDIIVHIRTAMARTGLSNTSVSGHTNEIAPLNVPITRVERIPSKVSEQSQRNQTLLNFAPGLVMLNVCQHKHLNTAVLDNFLLKLTYWICNLPHIQTVLRSNLLLMVFARVFARVFKRILYSFGQLTLTVHRP